MFEIEIVPALSDNYVYIAHDAAAGATAVVDPAEAPPVIAALERRGLKLTHILNTHHHFDHIGGNAELVERYGAPVIGPRADAARIPGLDVEVGDGDSYTVGSQTAQVFDVDSYSEERKADMRRLHGDEWETVARNYLAIRNRPELQEFYNLRASFPSVRCPVLITRGDRDDANHKLAYTYELKQGLENARLAITPGVGFSMAAGRPEAFRALLREFAAEVDAAAS